MLLVATFSLTDLSHCAKTSKMLAILASALSARSSSSPAACNRAVDSGSSRPSFARMRQ